jgi:hypothetical protein
VLGFFARSVFIVNIMTLTIILNVKGNLDEKLSYDSGIMNDIFD